MGDVWSPLAGRSAEVSFDSGYHFRLDYHKGNRMTWTSLREKDAGNSATEDIRVVQSGDGLYTVHWLESDGIEVVHAIDINKGRISGVVTWPEEGARGGRGVLAHEGSYRFVTRQEEAPFTDLQIVTAFWEGFFNRHDVDCADRYLADSYVQRSRYGCGDCVGLRELKAEFAAALLAECRDFHAEIVHSACEGGRVFIHSRKKMRITDDGVSSVDIFCVSNGRITERWVFAEAAPGVGGAACLV